MNILLLENMHVEVVSAISQVLLIAGHNMILYVNEKVSTSIHEIHKNTLPNNIKIYTTNNFLGSNEEIEKIVKIVDENQIDLLFTTTLQENFSNYNKLFSSVNIPKVLTIHNVNTWLKPSYSFRNPKKVLRSLYRKNILQKADVINVISDSLKDYIHNELKYDEKPVIWISSTTGDLPLSKEATLSKYKIIVPGSVDGERRDYGSLFNSLTKLKDYYAKFEIILLGKLSHVYPTTITAKTKYSLSRVFKARNHFFDHNNRTDHYIKAITSLRKNGLSINFYEGYISETEFNKQMSGADLILSPTKIVTSFDGHKEIYGKSKCSGNVNDMIRYRKPLLVPSKLEIANPLLKGCIFYEDLEIEVIKILEDPNFLEEKKKNAIECTNYYNPKNISKNIEIINSLNGYKKY